MGNTILAALALAVGPLAKRVLASLGIGFIAFAVLGEIAQAVVQQVQQAYGAMPTAVAAVADLLGVGAALGIILGAIVARASFGALARLGKL